jgi:hypothetical protein
MRTPSSAFPASPQGRVEGFGTPGAALPAGRFDLSLTTFFGAVADLAVVTLDFVALAFVNLALVDLAVIFLAFFVAMVIPSDFISCEARFAD